MVQRFQTLEQLRAWLDSDERHALLAKSNSHLSPLLQSLNLAVATFIGNLLSAAALT